MLPAAVLAATGLAAAAALLPLIGALFPDVEATGVAVGAAVTIAFGVSATSVTCARAAGRLDPVTAVWVYCGATPVRAGAALVGASLVIWGIGLPAGPLLAALAMAYCPLLAVATALAAWPLRPSVAAATEANP